MGMVTGVLSYALGTRRLGAATLLVSTVLLIVVLAVGNGDLPGIAAGW
jgi:MFS superfamily sulfate permease-like transporter